MKIGVIGTGAVAEISHLPTIVRMPELKLSIIADVNENRLKHIKKRFNLKCKITTDYKEVLEDKDIQGVLLLTPPTLHHKMTIEAAQNQKNVFVEKPFAMDSKEAAEMIFSCKKYAVVLNVGFSLRFVSQFAKINSLIKNNYFNKLLSAHSTHFTDARKWPSVTKFQLDSKKGGGALFEMGTHHIDLMTWFFGDPKKVSASIQFLGKNTTVDDYAAVSIQFKNGLAAMVNVGWLDIYANFINVGGTGGYATATAKKPEVIYHRTGHTAQAPIRMWVAPTKPINMELLHFYECVRGKEEPIVKPNEIIDGLKIIEAAYRSSQKDGDWISIPTTTEY